MVRKHPHRLPASLSLLPLWIKRGQGGEATADGGAFALGAIWECERLCLNSEWKGVGSAAYREDLKQIEFRGETLLLSSINRHGHRDVFQVLRKQHDEEDGPETETDHTQPGEWGLILSEGPESWATTCLWDWGQCPSWEGPHLDPTLQHRQHPAISEKVGCCLSEAADG